RNVFRTRAAKVPCAVRLAAASACAAFQVRGRARCARAGPITQPRNSSSVYDDAHRRDVFPQRVLQASVGPPVAMLLNVHTPAGWFKMENGSCDPTRSL